MHGKRDKFCIFYWKSQKRGQNRPNRFARCVATQIQLRERRVRVTCHLYISSADVYIYIMIFIYMKHPIDALKGGNFCIFRLKITEKEGKTDRERERHRELHSISHCNRKQFISDLQHTSNGRLIAQLPTDRHASKAPPTLAASAYSDRFFLHFLFKMHEKRDKFCIFY
jgi:hypothetical protein